jgi:hypothetical protein
MESWRGPNNARKRIDLKAFAMDEFKSGLIVAFENAVTNGVPPGDALAAALEWASSELERLREEPPARSRLPNRKTGW